jgi:hypothetical protein
MDCGSGPWGNIAIDATTHYVDQAFVGASDGSASAPWTTIGQAVAAAPADGLVAVAAGSYLEDVIIEGKSLRLHGVCPAAVELVRTGVEPAALHVLGGASDTEVVGLAIRGSDIGSLQSGSAQVALEHLWVHDNATHRIKVRNDFGAASFTLAGSLIERAAERGRSGSVDRRARSGTRPRIWCTLLSASRLTTSSYPGTYDNQELRWLTSRASFPRRSAGGTASSGSSAVGEWPRSMSLGMSSRSSA